MQREGQDLQYVASHPHCPCLSFPVANGPIDYKCECAEGWQKTKPKDKCTKKYKWRDCKKKGDGYWCDAACECQPPAPPKQEQPWTPPHDYEEQKPGKCEHKNRCDDCYKKGDGWWVDEWCNCHAPPPKHPEPSHPEPEKPKKCEDNHRCQDCYKKGKGWYVHQQQILIAHDAD